MSPRLLWLLPVTLVGCAGADEGTERAAARLPVTVVEARLQPVEERLRVLARVEAVVQPQVVAETSGRVRAVHVEPGDAVEAGALLFELEDRDQRLAVAAAEAASERLRALLGQQERQLQRLEQLGRRDAASLAARDEARAQRQALAAQLAEAEAALAAARLALERTRIVSPVAGLVDQRLVSLGDWVAPGKPVAVLIGRGERRLVLALPESLAPRLAPGLRLRAVLPDGALLETEVAALRPALSPAGRALEALATVSSPEAERLRPGTRLLAELVLATRESLWLPAPAVVERRGGPVVYVVEEGRARTRPVVVGVRRDGFVEVREGVEPGRRVVVEGSGFLAEGVPVAERGEGA